MALLALGVAAQDIDDERTVPIYVEALSRFRNLNNRPRIANVLDNLAVIANDRSDVAAARALVQEALVIQRETNDTWGAALSHTLLGELALSQNDRHAALAHFRECVALAWMLGDKNCLGDALTGVAVVISASGQIELATRLFGTVDILHETGNPGYYTSQFLRTKHQSVVNAARAELNEAAFVAEWDVGRALPLAQVLAVVQAVSEEPMPQRDAD
jgi:tetratricopeptide (TPR) repeat protein